VLRGRGAGQGSANVQAAGLLILICCLAAWAQQPQPTPRFAFLTDKKVITLAPGAEPTSLLIQNNTNERLTVDLKVIDLEPKGKEPISAAVKLERDFVELEPLASWAISISPPTKEPAATPKAYGKGSLVAIERGKPNFDRREIEIGAPTTAAAKDDKQPAPTPAPADTLDTVSLPATNFLPSLLSSFWSAVALLLSALAFALVLWRGYSKMSGIALVGLCLLIVLLLIGGAVLDQSYPVSKTAALIKVREVPFTLGKGLTGGITTPDGSVGRIVADGTKLTVSDLPRAGTYDGSLKLGPEKDARSVKVNVRVWDWWPYALLTIVCGVLVGYCLSRYFKQQRAEDALRLKVAQLWQRIVEDESRFQLEHGGRPFAAYRIAELVREWLGRVESKIAGHDVVAAEASLERLATFATLFAQFRAQLVILYDLQTRAWERIRQQAFGQEREDIRVLVEADEAYTRPQLLSSTEDEQGTQLKAYQANVQKLIDWLGALELNYEAVTGFLDDAAKIDKSKLTEADQKVLATQLQALRKAVRDLLLADSRDKLSAYYNNAVVAINAIRELTDKSSGESVMLTAANRSLRRGKAAADKGPATVTDIQLASPLAAHALTLEGNRGTTADLFVLKAELLLPENGAEPFRLKWDFDDGSAPVVQLVTAEAGNRATVEIGHRYTVGGSYNVSLQKFSGERLGGHKISVSRSPTRLERLLASFRRTEWQMTIISGLLTVGLGFYTLYLNKPVWGTTADYLYALLWGAGISEGFKYVTNLVGRVWNP
jgi:hypothetical protein